MIGEALTPGSREGARIYTADGLLNLIHELPVAIAVIDQNRRIILANRRIFQFTDNRHDCLIGCTGGEALGCVHRTDVPEGCGFGPDCIQCRLRAAVQDTIETARPRLMEDVAMTVDSGPRYLRIHTQPLNLDDDPAVLLSVEDITPAKELAQAAIEKEKLSAVIQTVGAVCHEMGQPLMVISGAAELLIEDLAAGAVQPSTVEMIKSQTDRLGAITRKLNHITAYRTKPYLRSRILDIDAASEYP